MTRKIPIFLFVCLSVLEAKVLIDEEKVAANSPYNDGKKTDIPISAESGVDLMQHWLDQAMSGLMAAVTTKKLAHLRPEFRRQIHECNKKAKTTQEHAQCVVKTLDLVKDPRNLVPDSSMAKPNKTLTIGESAPPSFQKPKILQKLVPIKMKRRKIKKNSNRLIEKKKKKATRFSALSTALSTKRRTKIRKIDKFLGKSAEKLGRRMRKRNRSNSSSSKEKVRRKKLRKMKRILKKRKIDEEDDGLEDLYAHHRIEHHDDFISSFRRAKRAVHNRDSYVLHHKMDRTPLGVISHQIAKAMRKLKGDQSGDVKNWKSVITEITEKARELKTREKVRKMLKKRNEYYAEMEKRGDQMDREINDHRPLAMPDLDEIDEKYEKKELLAMARNRLKNMTEAEKALIAPMQLVRQAVKLGMTMAGNNVSDFESKNINLISPRIFSVMPEDKEMKKDEINLLSPSLFSLHNEGEGLEERLSMSKALNTIGLTSDTQELMDMIVEVSGVGDAVYDMKKKRFNQMEKEDELHGPNGQKLFWSKENVSETLGPKEVDKVDLMEHLQRMYTPRQMEDMRHQGYTTLTPRQLDYVYGPRSPYNNSEALDRFKKTDLSKINVEGAIQQTIRDIADDRVQFKADPNGIHKELAKFDESKRKDIVLSPISFLAIVADPALVSQPLILSPVIFSALIVSPAVFGAIILSPWLFVAAILSPRVLSPVVLTPFGFVPIILTPLALSPIILSPGIFNPFVLSPLVLCPFVLSPQAFTPLILTPFALNPFILTPNLMSPLILSPFVLSPIILSPAYVTAIVLSPYALSPAVASNGAVVSVVASPSFLS